MEPNIQKTKTPMMKKFTVTLNSGDLKLRHSHYAISWDISHSIATAPIVSAPTKGGKVRDVVKRSRLTNPPSLDKN